MVKLVRVIAEYRRYTVLVVLKISITSTCLWTAYMKSAVNGCRLCIVIPSVIPELSIVKLDFATSVPADKKSPAIQKLIVRSEREVQASVDIC